jgi:hypothetical protein
MLSPRREPTAEECREGTVIENDGEKFLATWYPQMGGYVGKCWVSISGYDRERSPCFEVFVWHDGEFPFEGKAPVCLHHCEAEQFVRFGEEVLAAQIAESKK